MLQTLQSRDTNILIVEDDDVDVEVLDRLFKRNNVESLVHRASNGVEALDILRGNTSGLNRPFIILLDINMPLMNGIETLKIIRGDKNLKDSIVFMLTTSPREKDKEAAYELHVAGYFLKDNVKELVNLINNYCRINEFPLH